MAARLDLTATGVDVYCRSACSFELHFLNLPPAHRITTFADISSQSRCIICSNLILSIALSLSSTFPSLSHGRCKIVFSQSSQYSYSALTTSSSPGPRSFSFLPASRPSRNVGYLSSQNGRVPVYSQSVIPVVSKTAGSTRMLERVRS